MSRPSTQRKLQVERVEDRRLMAHSRKSYVSTAVDQGSGEVQIHLHAGGRESVDLGGGRTGQWARGSYAADEVAVLDQVFAQLQERTGNQRLLATARGQELHFYRHSRQLSGDTSIGGWKEGASNIHLTDMTFTDDTKTRQIVLHEIGHNWDDPEEHDLAGEFRAVSGWQEVPTLACVAGQNLSGDGHWVYDTAAPFVRDYGRLNPMEDFATSFAGYFLAEDYPGDSADDDRQSSAKRVALDTMFDDLSQDAELPTPDHATSDPDSGEVHGWGSSSGTWWGDAWRGGW